MISKIFSRMEPLDDGWPNLQKPSGTSIRTMPTSLRTKTNSWKLSCRLARNNERLLQIIKLETTTDLLLQKSSDVMTGSIRRVTRGELTRLINEKKING